MAAANDFVARWKAASIDAPPVFDVGDIVYENRRGWSGISLEVVEVGEVNDEGRCVVTVKGTEWFGVDGLYSERFGARVKRLSNASLTKKPNAAV